MVLDYMRRPDEAGDQIKWKNIQKHRSVCFQIVERLPLYCRISLCPSTAGSRSLTLLARSAHTG